MRIAIIGAGFGGMAAAYDLKKAGHEITIYESADYVGGLASGFKEPHWDWFVEKFYHHWFQSDKDMLGLIKELGWDGKVLFPRPFTVLLHNGKWYPFDSILRALLFPGLGFGLDKIRFGFVGLYLRLTNNWRALEKYTADEWMRKYAGRHVYEKMWKPLLVGKFGPYFDQVNMAWMWARLAQSFQGEFSIGERGRRRRAWSARSIRRFDRSTAGQTPSARDRRSRSPCPAPPFISPSDSLTKPVVACT